MQLEEYLQARIQGSIDDGVTHVASEFQKRFEDLSCITLEELVSWHQDVQRQELEAESFSMEHLYFWSLSSHLQDIILHAKLL